MNHYAKYIGITKC